MTDDVEKKKNIPLQDYRCKIWMARTKITDNNGPGWFGKEHYSSFIRKPHVANNFDR